MTHQIIKFFRRDAFDIFITVKDKKGSLFDLTGFVAKFSVKKSTADPDNKAKIGPIDGIIAIPESGKIMFPLTVSDTENITEGKYYFDVVIYNTINHKRHVVVYGLVHIINGVTISVV